MVLNGPILIDAFSYRAPRLSASLPVEFLTHNGVLSGSTRDLSEKGLSADFGEPLWPEAEGRLRFRIGRCLLDIDARVTHSEGFLAGLEFRFSSEQERGFLHAVLHVLSHDPNYHRL